MPNPGLRVRRETADKWNILHPFLFTHFLLLSIVSSLLVQHLARQDLLDVHFHNVTTIALVSSSLRIFSSSSSIVRVRKIRRRLNCHRRCNTCSWWSAWYSDRFSLLCHRSHKERERRGTKSEENVLGNEEKCENGEKMTILESKWEKKRSFFDQKSCRWQLQSSLDLILRFFSILSHFIAPHFLLQKLFQDVLLPLYSPLSTVTHLLILTTLSKSSFSDYSTFVLLLSAISRFIPILFQCMTMTMKG